MKENQLPRRRFLKAGGAVLALIPIAVVAGRADAATNAALRAGLKYQDKPLGGKNRANCKQFVPGASAGPQNGCAIMPGDTEISPQGYCIAWAGKA